MNLIHKPVKRLFTFGCSFTRYHWTTWPEIIATDLEIPFYNYGKSGAGNQYIVNCIMQADAEHHFSSDDLIIVSWTNVCREDRWKNGSWHTPGNIFNQNIYPKQLLEWTDPVGVLLRDLASIKSVNGFLESKKCQYHFLSMCDIVEQLDQGSQVCVSDRYLDTYKKICDMFSAEIKSILPSFYKTLWQNNIHLFKFEPEKKLLGNYFNDGHPIPLEHFIFLKKTFNGHLFKDNTIAKINDAQTNFINLVQQLSSKYNRQFTVYELSNEDNYKMFKVTQIKESNHIAII